MSVALAVLVSAVALTLGAILDSDPLLIAAGFGCSFAFGLAIGSYIA